MSKISSIKFFFKIVQFKKYTLTFLLPLLLLSNIIYAQSPISVSEPGIIQNLLSPKRIKSKSPVISRSDATSAVGLQQIYSSTGNYTLSADGKGSLSSATSIRVNKPNAQATVLKAFLMSSPVPGGTIANGCVTIAGTPVNWNGSASVGSFTNYWADVTSIVATSINSFPVGISSLSLTECNTLTIDGEALLVVFNDPTASEKTIIIMFGAQNPTGDNFSVTLAQPINPSAPGALLDMGLGIGYGFQGGSQFSQVSVNNQRLTTSAGGQDDGADANGALITVGGIDDVNTNPANPLAGPTNPRSDDELYSILPFITNTTTSLTINTINPSNDDNIFLAYFALSGAAIIGEGILLSQTTSSGNVGTQHTVKAAVLNSLGQPIANRLVTFTITSGPNAGNTFSTNTNASGEAFYTYTGSGGPGTDNIQACFTNSQSQTSCSNTLSFLWITPLNIYYSKATGDLHNVLTWGVNPDGSGANPPDFTAGKTFVLANRPGVYTMTNDWTVGGTIVNAAGSQLQINGFTLSEAALTGAGTLTGSFTSNLIVTGTTGGDAGTLNFTPGSANLYNFTLDRTGAAASATIGGTLLSVYNVLTLTNGTLNTNNALTLKSNVANTARVAPVTGAISGNVTVERYIPARRAWRILAAPVGGTQTISAAWQEGATTSSVISDPNPGFGTYITEGSPAIGFDQNPFVAMVSAKRYVSSTNSWVNLANTNATAVNSDAYMLFVRGNRGTPLGYNSVPATITTLRCNGPLKVGDQIFPVSGTGFTAIPNPFASPINFATLTKTGVQDNFYVWDPKVGGINGVGAYVTISFNGTSYDVSSNAISPESQFIQSGQGFLVSATTAGVAGSLTIKEIDKSNTAAADVFRSAGSNNNAAPVFADPTTGNGFRVQLQTVAADRTIAVLDEVFASYKSNYSNNVDKFDAVKAANMAENLGIETKGGALAIERRNLPTEGNIINLKLWNTEQKTYSLEFNPVNLSATGLYAYLEDKYLRKVSQIKLDQKVQYAFTITNDAASARADRFSITFSRTLKSTDAIVKNSFAAYPNPIEGASINLQFKAQHAAGTYLVSIVNGSGRVMLERSIVHTGGAAIRNIQLDRKLLTGVYKMQISNKATQESFEIISR